MLLECCTTAMRIRTEIFELFLAIYETFEHAMGSTLGPTHITQAPKQPYPTTEHEVYPTIVDENHSSSEQHYCYVPGV